MDFDLSEEQSSLREKARRFAKDELLPLANAIEHNRDLSTELVARLASQGFLGITVPRSLGGLGQGTLASALVTEQLATACASTAALISMQHHFIAGTLLRFGSEDQQRKWLPTLVTGHTLGAWAFAEPKAGDDIGALETIAIPQDHGFRLEGEKTFVSWGGKAQFAIALAKIQGDAAPSAFMVPLPVPGLSVGVPYNTLGLRGLPVVTLGFRGVGVGSGSLLGHRGQGAAILEYALEGARIGVAALCTGMVARVMSLSATHALATVLEGSPMSERQGVQFKLAEMAVDCEAARALYTSAASIRDEGRAVAAESAMAKFVGSEAASRATSATLQILGGRGLLVDSPIERFLRDAKNIEVCAGTSEVLRLTIASVLLKD